jgi:hypothetical protein
MDISAVVYQVVDQERHVFAYANAGFSAPENKGATTTNKNPYIWFGVSGRCSVQVDKLDAGASTMRV